MIPKQIPIYFFAVGIIILGFSAMLIPLSPAYANTTTTTIIGWNVPSGSILTNGIVAFILPIIIMGLLVGVSTMLQIKGTINSLLMKIGLLAGGILGMLSLTPTASNVIPFALPIVAGVYLITYLWKGV